MLTDYLVSICVPVYGVEKYIERCARSLFLQTYQNIEYIFVDDCSKDRSIELLNAVIAEYPDKSIQLIRFSHNRGLAAARNAAIESASGEFIFHVDSDDWIELDAVEVLVKEQRDTKADIVSGMMLVHNLEGVEELKEPLYSSKDDMLHEVIKINRNHMIHHRLIRKSLYTENNISAFEGANIGEDHYTLSRLVFFAKAISQVEKVVYNYNFTNEQSYSHIDSSKKLLITKYRCDINSINILLDFFKENDSTCWKELSIIKMKYAYEFLQSVLRYGNRSVFFDVCKDIETVREFADEACLSVVRIDYLTKHYQICRIVVWCGSLIVQIRDNVMCIYYKLRKFF